MYNTLTLDKIGKGLSITVTGEQIAQLMGHAAVAERIIRIGLSNILKDAHASVGLEGKTEKQWAEDSLALSMKTLDAMLAGEVRQARASTPKVDTETSVARKIILGLLSKDARKKLAEMPDKGIAALDGLVAKNREKLAPKIAAELARLAEEAKAREALASELDVDL